MAAQQIQFAETIRAMKLAVRRHASSGEQDDSDDDDFLHSHTNRGNKLRPGARYVRDGRLDDTGGLAYRKRVNHAGYERSVIVKRPRLYDEDGDFLESTDLPSDLEDDVELGYEPLKEYAFGQVHLEQLLRPLTAAAELATHPSFSIAYTSNAINNMADETAGMIRRERATLWKAKRLLERLRGDGAWMSGDAFCGEHDEMLLLDGQGNDGAQDDVQPRTDAESLGPQVGAAVVPKIEGDTLTPMDGIARHDHVQNADDTALAILAVSENNESQVNGHGAATHNDEMDDAPNNEAVDSERESVSHSGTNAPSHSMTTRARARSPQAQSTSPSPSPSESASVPAIHPWFIPPHPASSDRDLGLPSNEAEDTRKLLLLYVQKQENVIRQLEALYTGLQRTDRQRKFVWQACRAEGHMIPDGRGGMQTELSDGEDWYDPDDWNLHPSELAPDGKLEKGKDEIEDLAEEEGRRVGGRRRRVAGR